MVDTQVCIVGGGISGLYCAWRLACSGKSVVLIESKLRLGGRIDSEELGESVTEHGAMRFTSGQPLLNNLITELGLSDEVIEFPQAKAIRAYLRGQEVSPNIFNGEPDVACVAELPYNLSEEVEDKSPIAILIYVFEKILGRDDLLTIQDLEKVERIVSDCRFRGRSLYMYGFWNLAEYVLETEDYQFLLDGIGIESAIANWNAHRAIILLHSLLIGVSKESPLKTLSTGMESLIEKICDKALEAGVDILTSSEVDRIVVGPLESRVEFSSSSKSESICAEQIILAIPPKAVRAIDLGNDDELRNTLDGYCDLLKPVDATRIYLTYDEAWWQSLGYAITTLPLRQIYYWSGIPKNKTEAILMASYTDAAAAEFWSDSTADITSDHETKSAFRLADNDRWLVAQITKMLEQMHIGTSIPQPNRTAIIQWSENLDSGCAWHAWRPGVDASSLMQSIRHPSKGLHIVGEAWSNYQGWIEGALSSSEHVLSEGFGLHEHQGFYYGP